MWRPGPMELVVILGIVLIIFGPGKLPEVGRSIGKAISEFRKNSAGKEGSENGAAGGPGSTT